MSVLVKGMEMPSGCNMCQLRDLCYDYYICRAKKLNDGRYLDVDDVTNRRHLYCPLIEVPAPHSRLIDADELIGYLNEWLSDPVALSGFTRIINHQPTIIEAEVSGNA